MQLKLVKVKAR